MSVRVTDDWRMIPGVAGGYPVTVRQIGEVRGLDL